MWRESLGGPRREDEAGDGQGRCMEKAFERQRVVGDIREERGVL